MVTNQITLGTVKFFSVDGWVDGRWLDLANLTGHPPPPFLFSAQPTNIPKTGFVVVVFVFFLCIFTSAFVLISFVAIYFFPFFFFFKASTPM